MDTTKARPRPFDPQRFLHSAGATRKIVTYRRSAIIFSQGDPCTSVMYIHAGAVKLSLLSKTGKEAVVAMLGPGDFLGEGCLAGQPLRMATATAMTLSRILVVRKDAMIRLLHTQHTFSGRFITHMLARNIRIEEDLVDHLFTPARNGSPARCCWSRGTGNKIRRPACCPSFLKKCWRK